MTLNEFAKAIATNEKVKVDVIKDSSVVISYFAPGYEGLDATLLGKTVDTINIVSASNIKVSLASDEEPTEPTEP